MISPGALLAAASRKAVEQISVESSDAFMKYSLWPVFIF